MNIHALWCHPRSVSTAFERIMRERGDLDVLHEPFMYHYYINQSAALFPNFRPEPGHPTQFSDIRDMILARAENQSVFFKDMAYYVKDALPRENGFMQKMSHCFLIRDPAESILSYHRKDPDFALVEVGIEAQHSLYQALVAVGRTPLVITADDLRGDPQATLARYWRHAGLSFAEHAFEWDSRVPEGWESVESWHGAVLNSGAIQKPVKRADPQVDLENLGERFVGYDRHHRPFYEALKHVADHQK